MRAKNKIVIIMCCLIFVMVIGYAAFSTNLNINGTANIASTWKVEFTSIEEVSKSSGVTVKTAPTASGTMATFDVAFTSPGDSIEYDITIKNNGTLDAVIDSIKTTNTGSDAIKFEVSGVTEGDTLAKQATTKVKVKISYDSSVTTQPTSLSRTLTLNIIYVQNVSYSITDKPTSSVDDSSDVVFRSEANVASFVRVEVDNKVVDPANYTVTEGSTIITLKKEFLATLTTGTHTLSIVSKNGTASTSFEKKGALTLTSAILNDNKAQADTNIDFSQISSDTNGKGLYYTSTNTEDNKTTYYFRGDVQNNYVKLRSEKINACIYDGTLVGYYDRDNRQITYDIDEVTCVDYEICDLRNSDGGVIVGIDADECEESKGGLAPGEFATYGTVDELWRIIRINEDGSVRLIRQNFISESYFNTSANDNAYAGYMYGTSGTSTYALTHANTNSSTIKKALDKWYKTNLINYSSIIADSGFCGDRSLSDGLGYGKNWTKYGAWNRLRDNKEPQFVCPQNNDLYTTTTSTKGNKALTYPIGLVTADEVAYAGGVHYLSNNNYYFSNWPYFWTMTPVFILGDQKIAMFANASNGQMDNIYVTYSRNANVVANPVINIKSTVAITGGDGTKNNPYVIKTN